MRHKRILHHIPGQRNTPTERWPNRMSAVEVIEGRFLAHVEQTEGCWLWRGASDRAGYGTFFVGRALAPSIIHRVSLGRQCRAGAHRIAYALWVGEVPAGLLVCHHCDTPACVRPEHLFLGTHRDNMMDASRKGRLRTGTGTHMARVRCRQRRVVERVSRRLNVPPAVVERLLRSGLIWDTALPSGWQSEGDT